MDPGGVCWGLRPGDRIMSGDHVGAACREAGPTCGAWCRDPDSLTACLGQALGTAPTRRATVPPYTTLSARVSWFSSSVYCPASRRCPSWQGYARWYGHTGCAWACHRRGNCMEHRALVALPTSLKVTKAWPSSSAPWQQDMQDLAKLGEDGIQGLLQLILVEVVRINSMVGVGLGTCHGGRCPWWGDSHSLASGSCHVPECQAPFPLISAVISVFLYAFLCVFYFFLTGN